MNILPKKSWHVRNKDNIERVRRDEENARLEEEKRLQRAALAEQEARTKLLRDRVKESFQTQETVSQQTRQRESINLFDCSFSGNVATNKDYELDKKAEQEKKEKALGVLKYLGEGVTKDEQPWYTEKRRKDNKGESQKDVDNKQRMDPLMKMNSFLDQTKKNYSKRSERKKQEKMSKKSRSKKTIEELRAERVKREKEEQLRSEKFLREQKEGKPIEDDPYKDSYYSQFNPSLARKRKWNRH
ncbi:leukocyte receptor cluster member 1-like [Xenia sp. Carnegie-2017]|uniref:leukocyte receptor cluster member 1-like n=1 Tax=Xenia sp. Carnegie-2017 TaxID=2897299 RepID=UPI001F0337E9|nr:leukocyte receptor cluster member 1-like [Xenia sp. Carnegie-2017]